MKTLSFLSFAALAASSFAATVDQVIVRQQWPWSAGVKVEYKITGVTTPVDIKVKAYDGDAELDLPAAAVKGDLKGVTEDRIGQFVIDPVVAFGGSRSVVSNFKVKLELEDAVLYKVYDLTKGYASAPVTCITAADLRSGKYGTYEEDYANVVPGSSVGRVMIWTGVTNDVAYKTTHLVMRHVFAKNRSFTMGTTDSVGMETKHKVTFTNDFYVAVFPITYCQRRYIHVNEAVTDDTAMKPYDDLFGDARGPFYDGSPNCWLGWWPTYGRWSSAGFTADPTKGGYDCVESGKTAGRMRTRTGERFDLPTEAKWEYFCRAGTTTPNYAGENDDATVSLIAWYGGNSDGAVHEVGQKAPNPWGLYDLHGNVWEWCLDLYETYKAADDVVDPTGPDSTNRYDQRVVRGGSYATADLNKMRSGRRGDYNSPHHCPNPFPMSELGFRYICDVFD